MIMRAYSWFLRGVFPNNRRVSIPPLRRQHIQMLRPTVKRTHCTDSKGWPSAAFGGKSPVNWYASIMVGRA